MTKNIKEIGKELMGKSLNSFHRKTGLTQLENNNEMQDGILDGILSQVDDAYIEKTEQSNVIHLDGSGDGVVVVDSIEGNTMVNLVKLPEVNERTRNTSSAIICLQIGNSSNSINLKTNATYTCFVSYDIKNISSNCQTYMEGQIKNSDNSLTWFSTSDRPNSVGSYRIVKKVDTSNISKTLNNFYVAIRSTDGQDANATIKLNNIMFLEGDWTNKEVPPYFEGLQSSFEEHKTDEGQYEIEILNNNKNLLDVAYLENLDNYIKNNRVYSSIPIKLKPNTTYTMSMSKIGTPSRQLVLNIGYDIWDSPQNAYILANVFNITSIHDRPISVTFRTNNQSIYYLQCYENGHNTSNADMSQWFTRICENLILEEGSSKSDYVPNKQNKIKLLINEPLRSVPNGVSDRLCVKGNKLVIERNCKSTTIDGSEGNYSPTSTYSSVYRYWCSTNKFLDIKDGRNDDKCICDNIVYNHTTYDSDRENINLMNTGINIKVLKTKVDAYTSVNEYLKNNPIKAIYQLAEPYYEEVLNEYGEPIILEGYENGTLYIDSIIIPTTTVRYTTKMESLNTLKEVKSSNSLLSNDINESIIPYMMEVDMLIMEKEMSLFSSLNKNIRKMEVLDMTSMQKRTGEMLTRLIKGKTLTKEEAQTRVTVYLNADKITDAQAEELMLLIDEVYA